MRTTLTLSEEVAALIKKAMRSKKQKLKDVVNDALKRGLLMDQPAPRSSKRYTTPAHDGGKLLVPDINDIGGMLTRFDEGNLK